jgi:hypothetical protein
MIHFPLAPSFSVACLLCGTQEAEGAWLVLTEMVETSSPGRFAVPCRAPEFRHFCPSCAPRGDSAVTTIIDMIQDRNLLGALPAFHSLTSCRRWLVFLAAMYGLPLDQEQLKIFRHHTGRAAYAPPPGGYPTVVLIVGRQSGKTWVASTILNFEALNEVLRRQANPNGDRLPIFCLEIAQDLRSSMRTALAYTKAPFEASDVLRKLVTAESTDSLTLDGNVVLAAYPCRPAAVRGLRARVVVCDELAFFRSTEGNPLDTEMLRAGRPTLATTGGRLVILSSPAGQTGALHDLYTRHWGRDDSSTLVWTATAPEMNETLTADYLERMREEDPEGYRSEVLGEFRAGVTALFDPEALKACVAVGVRERPPAPGLVYRAHLDLSGGRGAAAALGVGHREPRRVVLDVLRAWPSPHNPSQIIGEAGALLRRYGLRRVTGDDYGAELARDYFRRAGITYEQAELNASALYLELLPVVNAAAVALLDLPELLRELRGLERRVSPSGRDRVVHAPREHDDRANAVAGVVYLLARRRTRMFEDYAASEVTPVAGRPTWSAADIARFTREAGGEFLGLDPWR